VNNNLNVDNTITYESNQFNTIVIRRFDESTTLGFNLNELQLWVNNENILPSNVSTLDAYFANWSDKDTEIPASFAEGAVRDLSVYLFNDIIEYGVGSAGGGSINAVIIKNIPLTKVNDIQSIVLYHRGGSGNVGQGIGLTIELYNNDTEYDPNLLSPLARTPVIETGRRGFRYDFPSIDTYTLGFSDEPAISQITLEKLDGNTWDYIIREDATIFNADVNINSNVDISGGLSCNTLSTSGNASVGGDVSITGTQINFNSDSFISNSAGGNSGNHLVVFVNGTEYKIKLENAS
jgi:hypothetical protein